MKGLKIRIMPCYDAKNKKIYNVHYKYKTKECLELNVKLHHSQQGREKIQELKERNYRALFRKREHKFWNRREETWVNLYRVPKKDTPQI